MLPWLTLGFLGFFFVEGSSSLLSSGSASDSLLLSSSGAGAYWSDSLLESESAPSLPPVESAPEITQYIFSSLQDQVTSSLRVGAFSVYICI